MSKYGLFLVHTDRCNILFTVIYLFFYQNPQYFLLKIIIDNWYEIVDYFQNMTCFCLQKIGMRKQKSVLTIWT